MGSNVCKAGAGHLCDPCKSGSKQQTLTLYGASDDILGDPEKLKTVIKTQAIIKGKIVRELVKRKRVQNRMAELGEFDYGPVDKKMQKGLVYRGEQKLEWGEVYKGQWVSRSSVREGQGMSIRPDGSVYEGWWKADMANGKGRFINADDQTVYEGNFADNQMHGHGVYTWKDGSQYEGQFQNN